MSKELLQELHKLYDKKEKRDVFGRRKATRDDFGRRDATPREIADQLYKEPTEADYPPTEEDIRQKGDDV